MLVKMIAIFFHDVRRIHPRPSLRAEKYAQRNIRPTAAVRGLASKKVLNRFFFFAFFNANSIV